MGSVRVSYGTSKKYVIFIINKNPCISGLKYQGGIPLDYQYTLFKK
jgi:hypothetical protein